MVGSKTYHWTSYSVVPLGNHDNHITLAFREVRNTVPRIEALNRAVKQESKEESRMKIASKEPHIELQHERFHMSSFDQ